MVSLALINKNYNALGREGSFFKALACIESGFDNEAVGKAGEVSRYQILPKTWKWISKKQKAKIPLNKSKDEAIANYVAKLIIFDNSAEFYKINKHNPTYTDHYIMWNAGFSYYKYRGFRQENVSKEVLDRATRFSELVKYYESIAYAVRGPVSRD